MEKLKALILGSTSFSKKEKNKMVDLLPVLDPQAVTDLTAAFEREKENLQKVYDFNNAAVGLVGGMVNAAEGAYKKKERRSVAEAERLVQKRDLDDAGKLIEDL